MILRLLIALCMKRININKKQVVDLLWVMVILTIILYLLFDIVKNYGGEDFPKRLMMFDKNTLVALMCFVGVIFMYILLSILSVFVKFYNNAPCIIDKIGIQFYYSLSCHKENSHVEWNEVKEVSIVRKKIYGIEMEYIAINLTNYASKKAKWINKYTKKSITSCRHDISFNTDALEGSVDDVYAVIINYWDEWKKNNEQKGSLGGGEA